MAGGLMMAATIEINSRCRRGCFASTTTVASTYARKIGDEPGCESRPGRDIEKDNSRSNRGRERKIFVGGCPEGAGHPEKVRPPVCGLRSGLEKGLARRLTCWRVKWWLGEVADVIPSRASSWPFIIQPLNVCPFKVKCDDYDNIDCDDRRSLECHIVGPRVVHEIKVGSSIWVHGGLHHGMHVLASRRHIAYYFHSGSD